MMITLQSYHAKRVTFVFVNPAFATIASSWAVFAPLCPMWSIFHPHSPFVSTVACLWICMREFGRLILLHSVHTVPTYWVSWLIQRNANFLKSLRYQCLTNDQSLECWHVSSTFSVIDRPERGAYLTWKFPGRNPLNYRCATIVSWACDAFLLSGSKILKIPRISSLDIFIFKMEQLLNAQLKGISV